MKFKLLALGLSLALCSNMAVYAKHATQATLDDAEKNTLATIAAIDKNEILAGKVAKNKNAGADVTKFANMMIKQHSSNLSKINQMEHQLKTGTIKSSDADEITKEGKEDLSKLNALKGTEFAHGYVDAMVKGHEDALKLIDDKLMQTAKNEEVKKFLTETRAAVETHLADAKKLQEELK